MIDEYIYRSEILNASLKCILSNENDIIFLIYEKIIKI